MKLIFTAVLILLTSSALAQTVYIPSGTSGIGSISGLNVGIGTSTPQNPLHLKSSAHTYMRLEKPSSSYEAGFTFYRGTSSMFYFFSDAGDNALKIMGYGLSGEANATPRMEFPLTNKNIYMSMSGGNVGIGTESPDAKLSVNGQIHATEVKVTTTVPAPDYVFSTNYNLPSLEQVKAYIDEHHHLPEVPSAKEMETQGVNVGEMNLLLLKKVEELTLYVLELKKEIEELKSKK